MLASRDTEYLRRRTHLLCRTSDDAVVHNLEPLEAALPDATRTMIDRPGEPLQSVARALLEVWLLKTRDVTAEERERTLQQVTDLLRETEWHRHL
jgi:hypothetical protein